MPMAKESCESVKCWPNTIQIQKHPTHPPTHSQYLLHHLQTLDDHFTHSCFSLSVPKKSKNQKNLWSVIKGKKGNGNLQSLNVDSGLLGSPKHTNKKSKFCRWAWTVWSAESLHCFTDLVMVPLFHLTVLHFSLYTFSGSCYIYLFRSCFAILCFQLLDLDLNWLNSTWVLLKYSWC